MRVLQELRDAQMLCEQIQQDLCKKHPDPRLRARHAEAAGHFMGPSLPACSGCMLVRTEAWPDSMSTQRWSVNRSDIECGRVNRPILSAPKAASTSQIRYELIMVDDLIAKLSQSDKRTLLDKARI
jgi:hypothetical protein